MERVHHRLSELLSTGTAKQSTIIVVASPNSRQLLDSRLTTPFTETATGSRINGDRSTKFVK
jgi:hypothetical protein